MVTFSQPIGNIKKEEAKSQKMASDPKVYTFQEVALHNKAKDCWLIVSGKVYDVTPFMGEHPGGEEVLLAITGKDGTDDYEDVGHSDSARAMMHKYYIGEIDTSTFPSDRTYITPETDLYHQDKTPEFLLKILQFTAPPVILALAFALRFYTMKD